MAVERAVIATLRDMGLLPAGAEPRLTPLAGGVSSDIWKVEAGECTLCVKRALPRLRVATEWHAPVERNAYEVAWIEAAGRIVPEAVPRLLGHAPEAGLFAMAYLPPQRYRPWKQELRRGRADPAVAAALGERLQRIHGVTARDPRTLHRFANDRIFRAIRLEPYFEATARAHPDRAAALTELVRATLAHKHCLIHGDVSPKNILLGPRGPVFLDAECACHGDPAFDLAFCLNHLLLKCLWRPPAAPAFLECFRSLAATYLAGVDWEEPGATERRAARLLPGLLLARVDGKSPVEYLTEERDKARVRRVARRLLAKPSGRLANVLTVWARELAIEPVEHCRR